MLLLEQVHSNHSNQSTQVPIAQPHGDSGLKAPERIAGHEVDAPLMPCSQRVRKWRQRQLAKLRSATNVAAEADLQPVTALGEPAAVSTQVSVRFDSPCSVVVPRRRPTLCRRTTVCRSMALPSYSAFAHVQAAVHEGGVGGAKPDAGIQSGPSDSILPTQHRRHRPYAHCANSIPAILYSLQHATYNMRLSNVQLASMRQATCKKCHIQHAASMVAAMHAWLQPCNM